MDHNLLVSELQSLVVESKRRHPEVKEAGDQALQVLKSGPLGKQVISQHADKLLAPITLGCKTKVGKIIGISISALQRLVALDGVPTPALPGVLGTLNSVAGQAVEIQLKILQTLLSILTHSPDMHDEVLGNALLLCFKLQDSRVSVVSSTAAATLRQAVMVVFDRVSSDTSSPSIQLLLPTDPPSTVQVTASAKDAFDLFSDLCILTAGTTSGFSLWAGGKDDKPRLLKLYALQRTFGLELVESVLSGYEEGVKKHPELLFLLSHSLDPLLIKLLHDKPSFPIALRVCRLQFLLIRSFAQQLPSQVEGYLTTLIRLGAGEGEGEEAKREYVPPWLRVLALEIFRGICGDGAQLQTLWKCFDQAGRQPVFKKLVSALGRLLNEKPVLLGIGPQMHGLGVVADAHGHGGYIDMGIGMMASAASAGITTVNSMMGSTAGGLGAHSGVKLRLIEQHDKAEAPVVPETYIYLLALQSLDAVAESIYVAAGQANDAKEAVREVRGMAESSWPALLAALSYGMGTNLSDGLFAEVLSALQDFTVACGVLGLDTPRDAFLSSLGKYSVPPPAVSAMQTYMDAGRPSQRNSSVLNVDALGLGSLSGTPPAGPPSLSERNLACLRSMVTTARILSATLGPAWHDVLEVLQNANFMLGARKPAARKVSSSPQIGSSPSKPRRSSTESETRPELFDDLDVDSIQAAINVLFDGSRDLDDAAFTTFVSALCQLSSEMIGVDAPVAPAAPVSDAGTDSPHSSSTPTGLLSPGSDTGKRRTSGLNISHSIKSGERSFSLGKLRLVSSLNLARLVNQDPSVGWNVITHHLISVARHPSAPTTLRIQASETLSELLLGAVRVGSEPRTQHQVFDVLVKQVDVYPISNVISTDHDVRSLGYQTLNQILESSGHSLEVGWQTIFGMLNNVCKDSGTVVGPDAAPRRPTTLSKSNANLVRIAFPSLNLICTDFLSSLDPESIRTCIACLGYFGRQKEDVNIALASIGLLWNVSDAVQGNDQQLWLYLLTELLELGRDPRLEVRSSAMQTLFRCVELYGGSLPLTMWEEVFWKVISPLLDSSAEDESSVLALTSVGSIFALFFPSLVQLESFERVYERLLERIEAAFKTGDKRVCTAALKSLEKMLSVSEGEETLAKRAFILDATWDILVRVSDLLEGGAYAQDSLVALVKIAALLHSNPAMDWTDEKKKRLSTLLRRVMTYDKSPEYRPDIDHMSPLQDVVAKLVGESKVLGKGVVLADLAEFASLAYIAPLDKVTYVGLTKYSLPRIKAVLESGDEEGLYEDGKVEDVIGAYGLPIKLKYDCPPANKFGNDPPLWKTAMTTFAPVLEQIMIDLDNKKLSKERFEGIWAQVVDILSGVINADTSADSAEEGEEFVLPILNRLSAAVSPRLGTAPEHLVKSYAETLRKASLLYGFDVARIGGTGTTAPAIPQGSERIRYWALSDLIKFASVPPKAQVSTMEEGEKGAGSLSIARVALPALLRRFEDSLRAFIDDARLRGHLPLGRVREDELLFILRHLATLRVYPDTLPPTSQDAGAIAKAVVLSPRAHLFRFYPLLLELSFFRARLPSMWVFPLEYAALYEDESSSRAASGSGEEGQGGEKAVGGEEGEKGRQGGAGGQSAGLVDAGDGEDMVEINARDLAQRCLELVGRELGVASR